MVVVVVLLLLRAGVESMRKPAMMAADPNPKRSPKGASRKICAEERQQGGAAGREGAAARDRQGAATTN